MPCYFQYDCCKRENSFYTESHTRSLKITWHIYCDCQVLYSKSREVLTQMKDKVKIIRSKSKGNS